LRSESEYLMVLHPARPHVWAAAEPVASVLLRAVLPVAKEAVPACPGHSLGAQDVPEKQKMAVEFLEAAVDAARQAEPPGCLASSCRQLPEEERSAGPESEWHGSPESNAAANQPVRVADESPSLRPAAAAMVETSVWIPVLPEPLSLQQWPLAPEVHSFPFLPARIGERSAHEPRRADGWEVLRLGVQAQVLQAPMQLQEP
jgi:hypothetical protein